MHSQAGYGGGCLSQPPSSVPEIPGPNSAPDLPPLPRSRSRPSAQSERHAATPSAENVEFPSSLPVPLQRRFSCPDPTKRPRLPAPAARRQRQERAKRPRLSCSASFGGAQNHSLRGRREKQPLLRPFPIASAPLSGFREPSATGAAHVSPKRADLRRRMLRTARPADTASRNRPLSPFHPGQSVSGPSRTARSNSVQFRKTSNYTRSPEIRNRPSAAAETKRTPPMRGSERTSPPPHRPEATAHPPTTRAAIRNGVEATTRTLRHQTNGRSGVPKPPQSRPSERSHCTSAEKFLSLRQSRNRSLQTTSGL